MTQGKAIVYTAEQRAAIEAEEEAIRQYGVALQAARQAKAAAREAHARWQEAYDAMRAAGV